MNFTTMAQIIMAHRAVTSSRSYDLFPSILRKPIYLMNQNQYVIKISFNDCQPKTIGFRVSTSNLGHLHG